MDILHFLAVNWDSVLVVVVAIVALIVLWTRGYKDVVKKILYRLVTEAEKEFGSGTGKLKLAAVTERLYEKLPLVIRIFVTGKQITNWIEAVLSDAKKSWEEAPKVKEYISGIKEFEYTTDDIL